MAETVVHLGPIAAGISAFLLAAYCLRIGWLILRRSQAPITTMDRIALWTLRVTRGADAARERAKVIAAPERRRVEGVLALAMGVFLALLGMLQIAAIVTGNIAVIGPPP